LHELKKHKQRFDKECLGFLDQRKQAKLQWVQVTRKVSMYLVVGRFGQAHSKSNALLFIVSGVTQTLTENSNSPVVTGIKCIHSQHSETNVMHFLFILLRIKGLYIFRALLAYPQEALHKRHLCIACVLCQLAVPLQSW
jgi:hypothetical protein